MKACGFATRDKKAGPAFLAGPLRPRRRPGRRRVKTWRSGFEGGPRISDRGEGTSGFRNPLHIAQKGRAPSWSRASSTASR